VSPDVVVLGAGHDGLCAAAHLARAGRSVLVVDRIGRPGGLAAHEEFAPGFSVPGVLHETHLVRRAALEGLRLEEHGLRWRPAIPDTVAFGVADAAPARRRVPRRLEALADAATGTDAERLARLRAWLGRVGPALAAAVDAPAPPTLPAGLSAWRELAARAWGLRRIARADLLELARVLPGAAWDWIGESVGDPLLAPALAAQAVRGEGRGPRAAGTAALLLLDWACADREVDGGPAALTAALVASATAAGVELRLDADVERLVVERGRIEGVRLADGETIPARAVASTLDLRRTVLDLIEPAHVPERLERDARGVRGVGASAVLRLALERAPFGDEVERALVLHDVAHIERTSDDFKHRRLPASPWLDVSVPSLARGDLAPPGRHVASIHVHAASGALEGGWTDAARAALLERVLEALERAAPGVRDAVLAHELLAPPDLAARYGASGGHLFHAERTLDQLWLMRPGLRLSRGRTPIAGLWVCGPGCHPGGPFRGSAGALGARAILGDGGGANGGGRR